MIETKAKDFERAQQAAIERAGQRCGFSETEDAAFRKMLSSVSHEEFEVLLCAADPEYFVSRYVKIYDPQALTWVPFELWPEQVDVLNLFHAERLIVVLKARQLGLTWLALAYALWQMLFAPIATIMIFNRRDDESIYLLSDERLKGMYYQLPVWLRARAIVFNNAHMLKFSNGSVAYAFPTTAGDSYTATLVIMDEADLMPDLNRLMRSVKPTIDAGGKLIMISRADKGTPNSEFKRVYMAAKEGRNGWAHVFLPWHVRPERDETWYAKTRAEILERTGSDDDLHEQYPARDVDALAPRTLDKRIPPAWISKCYREQAPLPLESLGEKAPNTPGLLIYQLPQWGVEYAIGADPAEGNPTSDDSALSVVRTDTNEEAAMLAGKFEPAVFAAHIDKIGKFYNQAGVMVERNNHGHAVLLWLRDYSRLTRMVGLDKKEGWLSSSLGKTQLYDNATNCIKEGDALIHSFKTYYQLQSIEGATLRAPEGDMDDCADAYAMALTHRIAERGKQIAPRMSKASPWPSARNRDGIGRTGKSLPGGNR